MKKTFYLLLTLLTVSTVRAQITNSLTIPNPIPNYDGSYDDFGRAQLYYPNAGEVRYANDLRSASDSVKFYTMFAYPKRFLLANNNISLCYSRRDTVHQKTDSLQRIDLQWVHKLSTAFLARVDTQLKERLHYFTNYTGSGGRTNVQGGAAIACQSIYHNIDLVYTSNTAGLVMYFIIYPGGNYKDIQMHIAGSTANGIVSNNILIQSRWDKSRLLKPNMYQYSISGNVITPVNVLNASWTSLGGSNYQLNTTSSYNSSLPLIVQIQQGTPSVANTPGLQWSTYYGGSQLDLLTTTHCDAADNLYVAGYTDSNNFPNAIGAVPNVFVEAHGLVGQFSPTGVLNWSCYMGGTGQTEIYDMDFDASGNIYCVGRTGSTNFPTTPKAGASPNNASMLGGNWDAFIWEFSVNNLGAVTNKWLTYYGGNGDEELNGCKFDPSGNFYVAGDGSSTNMTPMGPSGSYQQNFNSAQLGAVGSILSTDAMIAKFNSSSSQTWFTFFGTDNITGTNAGTNAGDYFYDLTVSGSDVYACGKSGGTNLPSSINTKIVPNNYDGTLVHFTTGGVLNANSSRYTDGNISNYSVKTLYGDVYTVGQTVGSLSTVNSGNFYYNAFSSGPSDACFSVHSGNLATVSHNTYLGGNADDIAYDLQLTTNNLFVIAGGTNSSNFPVFSLGSMYNSLGNPIAGSPTFWGRDNVLVVLQKNNTNILYSTYLGSTFNESLAQRDYFNEAYASQAITAVALNSQNYIHVLGYTTSQPNGYPPQQWGTNTGSYYQPNSAGFDDATITRFDPVSLNATVGIKDFENTQFVFGVYPNPTSNKISITNTEISNSDLRYAIYDLSGKKLAMGNLRAGDVKDIDVSFLSQGVYIINVSNGLKTYSNKFVKTDN